MKNICLFLLSSARYVYRNIRFNVAMAACFNMAAIWLRKIFLNIYIKQFLAIKQWNYLKRVYQKCFRLIVNDIKFKMATEFKMAADIDSREDTIWHKIQTNNAVFVKVMIACFIYSEE